MTEENGTSSTTPNTENKQFGILEISVKEAKRKEIERLAKQYPLSKILEILEKLGLEGDLDNDDIETRIANKIQEELLIYHVLKEGIENGQKLSDLKINDTDQETIIKQTKLFGDYIKEYDKASENGQIEDPNKFDELEIKVGTYFDLMNHMTYMSGNERKSKINKSLLSLRKQPQIENEPLQSKINQMVAQRLADDNFLTVGKKNEHSFDIKESKDRPDCRLLAHLITNIDGSGLTLEVVDNKVALTAFNNPMSEEQLFALAKFCYYNGIDIESFRKLKDLPVYRKTNDEQRYVGTLKECFNERMNELAEYDKGVKDKEITATGEENSRDTLYHHLNINTTINPSRGVMLKKAQDKITNALNVPANCMRISRDGNRTVISVYKSPEDMEKDNLLDSHGHVSHTKRFSVFLEPSVPPRVSFYLAPGEKFEANHARVALTAFKSAGCKYFKIPSGDVMGSGAFAAFMEASAKELMVPLLATKDTPDGANLSAGDLGVLLKTIDEIHKKGTSKDIDDVLEYKILVQAEVKDHLRYLTEKAQKDSSKKVPAYDSLNKQLLTLDKGIKFAKFAKSYSDDISKFVEDGVNGEFGDKWDSVDCMAAKYAMLNVLKDINAGVLMSPGGEKLAFDPLDKDGKNRDKILDAMVIYMNQEKPNIVMNIATMRSEADGYNDRIDSAVKNLDAKYTKGLKKYYEENVQTESISFSISFVEPSITLKKSKYFEETQTSGRSGQNDKYAKAKEVIPPPAVGESRKDLTKRLSRGPQKRTFSWEKLDRYDGYY